jgi:hypothetical protein
MSFLSDRLLIGAVFLFRYKIAQVRLSLGKALRLFPIQSTSS